MQGKIKKTLYWKYHHIRSLWPVWYYALNRNPRKLWRNYKQSVHLNAVQQRILEDIQQDGIAITHVDELFANSDCGREVLAASMHIAQNLASEQKIRTHEQESHAAKSDIIVHLYGGYGDTKPSVALDDPFLRFTLAPQILHIVSSYMDMFAFFKMCSLHSTILLPAGSRALFAQRWHRDPDDKKLVKVFLYASDVDNEGAGPFTYVKGSHLGGRWREIYPQIPPVGSYPPHGAVERAVPSGDILHAFGKTGTMIFCDTSGLHKGGYSTEKRRLMYAATFTSAASALLRNYTLADQEQTGKLDPIAQYAIS